MRRVVGILLLCLLLPGTGWAQSYAYNPRFVQFDHPDEDFAITGAFLFEFWDEAETRLLFTASIPKADVETTGATGAGGPVRQVAWEKFPAATIGVSYKIRARAIGEAASDPSNFAPELVRFSACYNPATQRNQPVVVTLTSPLTIPLNGYLPLQPGQLTVTGPSPVTSLSVEALGDGFPAQYFTLTDLRSGPLPVLGPFRRTGTYSLVVRAVDERGCEGTQATPFPRITVTP